ncbi:MAG: M23 family metallopeptidase [Burkholderiales bacterium]
MTALRGRLLVLTLSVLLAACGGGGGGTPRTLSVVQDDPVYPGEDGLRVGYMLKTWEYERDGLVLDRIEVLDGDRGAAFATLVPGTEAMPRRYQDPLPAGALPQSGPLGGYFFPIQVQLPAVLPSRVATRLVLHGPGSAGVTVVEGASFVPRTAPAPVVIASPLRGRNLILNNQGSSAYHFDTWWFRDGVPYSGLAYAFDTMQTNDALTSLMKAGYTDTRDNNAYVNYGQDVYAAADGVVVELVDGYDDQKGNAVAEGQGYAITLDNVGGNHLVIRIGDDLYTMYGHLVKGSFGSLKVGDAVVEGQKLARLGNSGNSTGPHLHFQVMRGRDIFFSRSVPFVLKQFTRTGDLIGGESVASLTARRTAPVARAGVMPEPSAIFEVLP